MRSVDKARDYKKDFQRESAGRYRTVLADELPNVIALLANDIPLPKRYYDHALIGNWAGHRDCHIRSDLLLIMLVNNEFFIMYAEFFNDSLGRIWHDDVH